MTTTVVSSGFHICAANQFDRGSGAYILFSFALAPPEIFCVRNWPNSFFRSSSCFRRSSFDLPQSWFDLTLPDDYA